MSSHSRTPSLPVSECSRVYELNPCADGEDLEKYRKNGLHPVEVDESYHHDKYRILYKLGHGGSSTVWIAQNSTDKQLCVLKFLSSSASAKSHESSKTLHINSVSLLKPFIIRQVDSFQIHGPNCSAKGMNKVLVFDLHGPSVMQLSHECLRMHPSIVQKVMHNTTKAISKLHQAGYVHLDLTPNNVLLKLDPKIRHLSQASLYAKFGQPWSRRILRMDGQHPRPHAPDHCFWPIDFTKTPEILCPETVLIDFGEAEELHRKRSKLSAIPSLWAAPEAIFENRIDPSCDVWSLGCLIYRARAGSDLFPGDWLATSQAIEVAHQMVFRIGPPPLAHWKAARYSERTGRFALAPPYKLRSKTRETSTWITRESLPEFFPPLEMEVRRIRDRPTKSQSNKMFWSSGGQHGISYEDLEKYPLISSQEADLLYDLLSKIFVWDPAKRISAAKLLGHPWFKFHKH